MKWVTAVAKTSRPIRHLCVKMLAPQLYQEFLGLTVPRGTIEAVKQKFGKQPLVGAEIGVFRGHHAYNILRTLNVNPLYLIDPYTSYVDFFGYNPPDYLADAFLEAKNRLTPHQGRVVWIHKPSCEAINSISDNLDFVYIDGNHNYEFVKNDISLYYPKVRSGGIMGGHDFEASCRGVVNAVTEFASVNDLTLQTKAPSDWWIEKGVE